MEPLAHLKLVVMMVGIYKSLHVLLGFQEALCQRIMKNNLSGKHGVNGFIWGQTQNVDRKSVV